MQFPIDMLITGAAAVHETMPAVLPAAVHGTLPFAAHGALPATMLYIDPGTGSMLFTILIGVVTTMLFFVQKLIIRLKFLVKGGRGGKNGAAEAKQQDRIPYLIFSDSKRYWNVFEPIADEFERRKIPLVYWTVSEDDPALAKSYSYVKCSYIGTLNQAVPKLNLMDVGICLSTTPGLDVYQWKRSRNTSWYVHILHAAADATLYRMFGLDHYDAVLLSGEYEAEQIRALEKIRHLPAKDLQITGLTYLDEMKKRAEALPPRTDHTFTVLLAPSWGQSSILVRYGDKIIESLLRTGYKIIIRPHPQSRTSDKKVLDSLMAKYPDGTSYSGGAQQTGIPAAAAHQTGEPGAGAQQTGKPGAGAQQTGIPAAGGQISWNYDNDNFHVLSESDIMISDFSGVIFDYTLIFDRPLIYADTHFDKSPDDAAWLEEEPWTFKTLPTIGVPLREEDFPRIKDVIDDAAASTALAEGRDKARAATWQHIGESTKRTVDYMTEKYSSLTQ